MRRGAVAWGLLILIGAARAQFTTTSSFFFDLPGDGDTFASRARTDSAGNIYLGGSTGTNDVRDRAFVTKLSPDGVELWTRLYSLGNQTNHYISGLVVDSTGRLQVAGSVGDWYDPRLTFLVSYDENGNFLQSTNLPNITINGLESDSSNNLCFVGETWTEEPNPASMTTFVAKCSPTYEPIWTRDLRQTYGQGFAKDSRDNVYVAQLIDGRLLVTMLDAAGATVQTCRYSGPPVINPPSVWVDPEFNVFACADSYAPVLVKFGLAAQDWATRVGVSFNFGGSFVPENGGMLYTDGRTMSLANSNGVIQVLGDLPDFPDAPREREPVALLRTGPGRLLLVENHWSDPQATGTFRWRTLLRTIEETNSAPALRLGIAPGSSMVWEGQSLTLKVAGMMMGPLTYQWYHDAPITRLEGQTNATLVLSNIQQTDTAAYWVEVNGPRDHVTSAEVVVDVFRPPASRIAVLGETITLAASGTLTTPSQTQWSHNGTVLPATNESLVLTNVTVQDAGEYEVTIGDAWGGVFTAAAQVEVRDQVRLHWQKFFPYSYFNGMEIDPFGRVVLIGWTNVPLSDFAAQCGIIDQNGQGAGYYLGPGIARSMAVDEAGNIYLSFGMNYSTTVYTRAYSPGFGGLLWERTNIFKGDYSATPGQPARVADGTFYTSVRGRIYSGTSWLFYSLMAVSATNSVGLIGGGGYDTDESILDLQAGRSDDFFVLTSQYPPYNTRTIISRVRKSGGAIWRRNLDTNGYFSAIAVDATGSVLLAGSRSTPAGSVLLKISPDNQVVWSAPFSGTLMPRGIKVDFAGNIVVTGTGGTLKYEPNGALLWSTRTGGNYLGIDGTNNIYVAGPWDGPLTVTALNASGSRLWQTDFSSPDAEHHNIVDLAVGANGDVFVVAVVQLYSSEGYSVAKYSNVRGLFSPPLRSLAPTTAATPGQPVTLTVPTDARDATYQWFFNGTPIADATNANLILSSFSTNLEGGYAVEIRNSFGSAATAESWLTVPPMLTQVRDGGWSFTADARYRYTIEASTNLQDWATDGILADTGGAVVFGTNGVGGQRFFRVVAGR